MPTITISGPPGSGTTTVAKLLMEKTSLKYVYAGQIFRDKAKEMGMDLLAFGDYVEKHPEIDRELDEKMKQIISDGNVIAEGRVCGWLSAKHKLDAFKVFLDAPEEIRASRVADREKDETEEVLKDNREREESERLRYKDIYGFDILDTSFYDLVIDTSDILPEPIAEMILKKGGFV